MARYHINGENQIGKCRMFAGSCFIAKDSAHFTSWRAAAAVQNAQPNSPTLITAGEYGRMALPKLAELEQDYRPLMAAALWGSKKAIISLSRNPATPGAVLAEARTKRGIAYHWLVDLEDHPNYPDWARTGEGLTRITNRGEFSKPFAKTVFAADDATDEHLRHAFFADAFGYGADPVEFVSGVLRNSRNRVSSSAMVRAVHRHPAYARAAAESGRFPTAKHLSMAGRADNSSARTVAFSAIADAIPAVTATDRLEAMAAVLHGTDEWLRARDLLANNLHTPASVLRAIYFEPAHVAVALHPSAPADVVAAATREGLL